MSVYLHNYSVQKEQHFVTTTRFSDLAEFENRRRTNLADREFQVAIAKFTSLSRAPAKFELFEVLVPLPPGSR